MMKPAHSETQTSRCEAVLSVLLFCGLLAFHGWGGSVGWKNLNLPGVEFRQTQTAISAFFIQRDHDFSLAYPTPVLGKPWSVPMEFPLYQWTVVLLSDATGLDLTKSGRTVSLACFYLSLPALFLLLGSTGLVWPRRLVALGFVLSCPLYIFYGRAFLIETMALMFALWFLVSYLRALEKGSALWWLFASLAGSAAGLVKVTTLLFILLPACGWTVLWLWQQRPGMAGGSGRIMARTAIRALTLVVVPGVAAWWWLRFADATKALNPAAEFLASDRLSSFIFGSQETRFSAALWREHFAILFRGIVGWWVLAAAGILALTFTRRWWRWIALLVGCFFAVQLIFPVLYALHDYYYVANAFTLLLAVGLIATGLLESRLPRTLAWGLILLLQAGQVGSYLKSYYPEQRASSPGGSPVTQALRAATSPDDVLIIAGEDWCANSPYFAQRRALMFRNGIEGDAVFGADYFGRLRGESVGALVLAGKQRDNRELLERAVRDFDIDPRPVFTALESTVYFQRRLRLAAITLVKTVADPQSVQLTPESMADANALLEHEIELAQLPSGYQRKFSGMSPLPFKYYVTYGLDRQVVAGHEMFFAHPDTRLWFRASIGRHNISIEAQLNPEAYAESLPAGDRSDGVEVSVSVERANKTRQLIFSRWLNPRDQPDDRGLQTLTHDFELGTGEVVVVEVGPGPHGSLARDWAMLGRIEIK